MYSRNRKFFDAASAAFAIAMCPCVIAFGLGFTQVEPAGQAVQDVAAYAPAQEEPLTAFGGGAEAQNETGMEETPGAVSESKDENGNTMPGDGQGTVPETEIETESVRERAELMAKVKHLADYAGADEPNPDYRKIGYVYTEEMYYKLTGATELPDDWTDRMSPLMRGIISEEDGFVETPQTDDGALQAQWRPDSGVNAAMYQTTAYTGTAQNAAIGAVQAAQRKLGYPYSQSRRDSGIAYDCSSLVYWSYLEAGVNIDPNGGHTAASIAFYLENTGRGISGGDLRPGDLIFYSYKRNGRYKNISHVAMVAGDGMIVHASSSKKMVVMSGLTLDRAVAIARPMPDVVLEAPETGEDMDIAEENAREPSQETGVSQYGPGMTQEPEEKSAEGDVAPAGEATGDATLATSGKVSPVIITGTLQEPFIRAYYVPEPDGLVPGMMPAAAWEKAGSRPGTGSGQTAQCPIQI